MFIVSERPEDGQQQRPKYADINFAGRTILKVQVGEIQQDVSVCRFLFTAKLVLVLVLSATSSAK